MSKTTIRTADRVVVIHPQTQTVTAWLNFREVEIVNDTLLTKCQVEDKMDDLHRQYLALKATDGTA